MTDAKHNPPLPSSTTQLIDTHCHLDMDAYSDDLKEVIVSAAQSGVNHIIAVGIDYPSSIQAVKISNRFQGISAAVGIHPHNVSAANEQIYTQLIDLANSADSNVVGYGEIGLDYAGNHAPKELQNKEFAYQLGLAKDLKLPVIIHDRDAHDDTLRLLREASPFPAGGVMHCFSGDRNLADRVLALGFYISIPGIVTFKNAKILQQVARHIPMERMVLETDGPFLAPVPWRGKRNKPEYIIYTAQKIADLRHMPLTEVADRTYNNARTLFRL